MTKKALFVIDTQAELVSIPSTAMPHGARVCEVGGQILDRARRVPKTELEIIIVQHYEEASDPNATLIRGSKAWELALPPREGAENERVVEKTTGESRVMATNSGVYLTYGIGDTFESNPSLAHDLKSRGVTTIVAFGVQSECCVRATCRGALKAGFDVVLLQGAHSTYNKAETGQSAEDIEKEIEHELQSIGVQIVPWDQYAL
ncbi:hypothetical protein N7520_005417 [Penicillium odoratum]|uniref:uncharacterized protein n=1 Tax=Penicillium odoratum TaxID=1167516 RepID=UPI0025466BBC|nr:uncharacterized protein N7520_005417 [Penicillium odoratum]KAJ5765858.1 hypothetical protein N7520_005417 [Penicillium odoratum]